MSIHRTVLVLSRAALCGVLAIALLASTPCAQLDLPDRPRPVETPEATAQAPTRGSAGSAAQPPADPLVLAVSGLVERLNTAARLGGPELRETATALLALGDGGRAALDDALAGSEGAPLLAAAQALLGTGLPDDFDAVAGRLRARVPGRVVQPLLRALRSADPVRAGPAYLVDLLDHPQSTVRLAARSELEPLAGPELLPHLVSVLTSRRVDTRLAVVQLAATIDDPSVSHMLLELLGDTSSKVAFQAAALLALSEDTRVVPTLLERALPTERFLGTEEMRRSSYALLALMEREDHLRETLLREEHAAVLLEGLRSPHPARSGACAAGLAGIGFRSARPEDSPWLDLEVPHELVKVVSGAVFHSDFTSLQAPCLRRLTLITGESFGSDGPAWQAWWGQAAGTFHARRAVLTAQAEDAARLLVEFRVAQGAECRFVGPDVAVAADGVDTLHLTELAARDFLGVLRREGVLDAKRLPGRRGPRDGEARTLVVSIDEQSKRFEFAGKAGDDWFERVLDYAGALEARNRWQRYPDPLVHSSRRALWEAEREWWEADHGASERSRRLIDRILAWLAGAAPPDRQRGLSELAALYELPGAPAEADFERLVARLREEVRPGARGRMLVDMALASAGASGAVSAVRGQEVLQGVLEAFRRDLDQPAGAELVARILQASPPEVARTASVDSRSVMRAAAAEVLATDDSPESSVRFAALFDDVDPTVQIAAARAAGAARDQRWRTILLERAKTGLPEVRASAMRAVAHLGGVEARDAIVSGLHEPEPLRSAAAEGLATLADPTTTSLLVALLVDDDESTSAEHARRGLLRLGEAAWPDLMRAVHVTRGRESRAAALVLAEQGVPEVASTLLGWLTEHPDDARVAWELAVLTCIDKRSAADPAGAWWEWWDLVVHDDSRAWLRAALERAGITAPPPDALNAPGTREAADSLHAALSADDAALAERARRELERLLGREVGTPPPVRAARDEWLETLRQEVQSHYEGTGGTR